MSKEYRGVFEDLIEKVRLHSSEKVERSHVLFTPRTFDGSVGAKSRWIIRGPDCESRTPTCRPDVDCNVLQCIGLCDL